MGVCKVCGKEIPRGKKYQGDRYKSTPLCSKECYEQFVKEKDDATLSKPLRKLKDYINDLYGGNVNWTWIQRQINSMMNEYGLEYNELRMVIRYAVVYDHHCVDVNSGLMQFVKYIEPAFRFAERLERNKKLAEEMPEQEYIYITPHKQRRKVKEEDWDD